MGEGVTGVTKSRDPGPWQALGGPGKTKSCTLNGGPQRPNHTLQKGSGKWNMAVSQPYPCCSFNWLMVGTRPYLSRSFGQEGPKGTQEGILGSVIRLN
jgi:hypothetical protein